MYSKKFEMVLPYVFASEGGFSDNPNDMGGRTNYGITQKAYNSWNDRHKIPRKDVKQITKEEAKQICYYDYWIPSGAEKMEDLGMAYAVFDTEFLWGHGDTQYMLKNSGGDLDKFLNIRNKKHKENIEKNQADLKNGKTTKDQKRYEEGWSNRIKAIKNNAQKLRDAQQLKKTEKSEELSDYEKEYEKVKKDLYSIPFNYQPEEIQALSNKEFLKKQKEIEEISDEARWKVQELLKRGVIKKKNKQISHETNNNKENRGLTEEQYKAMMEGFDSGMIADEDHGIKRLITCYQNIAMIGSAPQLRAGGQKRRVF